MSFFFLSFFFKPNFIARRYLRSAVHQLQPGLLQKNQTALGTAMQKSINLKKKRQWNGVHCWFCFCLFWKQRPGRRCDLSTDGERFKSIWGGTTTRSSRNTFSMSSMQAWRSMPKSMKVHSIPSRLYSSCSSTNMWWLKNCCSFSLVKLMHSCSKPLNCVGRTVRSSASSRHTTQDGTTTTTTTTTNNKERPENQSLVGFFFAPFFFLNSADMFQRRLGVGVSFWNKRRFARPFFFSKRSECTCRKASYLESNFVFDLDFPSFRSYPPTPPLSLALERRDWIEVEVVPERRIGDSTFSMSSIQAWRSMPKSMKTQSIPSRLYSSCSSTNMWWLKNCCSFSLVKLMQSCSKPLNCGDRGFPKHSQIMKYPPKKKERKTPKPITETKENVGFARIRLATGWSFDVLPEGVESTGSQHSW